ncbi:MAG: SpaH/EbpB family LPXTG-anchored major pilin [Bifidobacteriaceae bacterium]|jgi:fimbrial isopeptide formation D2 family protein/LPXTG-motif cell wall-anchored protein|nr:SpaH/EbpB family LPXTG-anchored major pilin [Bifidobacteriaceae bacterium]MCI1915225.1 SpaH/EbpB family LPXTG-anchored major pilin [Bifidobacteriaceae bacterium]
MKLRNGVAVVVTAAMALSGLAIGASTASAEETTGTSSGTATITVQDSNSGHVYTAYKLAAFSNPVADAADSTKISSLDISTETSESSAIADVAVTAKGVSSVPSEYTNNPVAWVATDFDADMLRRFADGFTPTSAAVTSVTGKEGSDVQLSGLDEGWYYVTDTDSTGATTGPSAVVSSTIDGFTSIDLDPGDKEVSITDLGTFVSKAVVPTTPVKSVDRKNAIGVGDDLTYTLSDTIPADIASYDSYEFSFVDTPSVGLTVHPSTLVVTVGSGSSVTTLSAADGDFTVNPSDDFKADGSTTFTIDLSKWITANAGTAAGQFAKVTYHATVNSEAAGAGALNSKGEYSISNQVTVHTTPGDSGKGQVKNPVGTFDFTKINSSGDGLGGAEFEVTDVKGAAVKFTQDADGVYVVSTDASASSVLMSMPADAATSSVKVGQIKVRGIAPGNYTVEETKVPTGYLSSATEGFTVYVDNSGKGSLSVSAPNLGLVNTRNRTVLNVTSITQLPLTGGAGIALFVVLGALVLGGAGVTLVHVRRRAAQS